MSESDHANEDVHSDYHGGHFLDDSGDLLLGLNHGSGRDLDRYALDRPGYLADNLFLRADSPYARVASPYSHGSLCFLGIDPSHDDRYDGGLNHDVHIDQNAHGDLHVHDDLLAQDDAIGFHYGAAYHLLYTMLLS